MVCPGGVWCAPSNAICDQILPREHDSCGESGGQLDTPEVAEVAGMADSRCPSNSYLESLRDHNPGMAPRHDEGIW